MNRRLLLLQGILALLFGATAWLLHAHVDIRLADAPGVRLAMPVRVGAWQGRQIFYCHAPDCGWFGTLDPEPAAPACPSCGAPLFPMALTEKELLPDDTHFLKVEYRRGASRLHASIVLSGDDRNSIHRPQRCLVAQGNTITASHTERISVDGRPPLRVMLLETVYQGPLRPGMDPPRSEFAYWFVGVDRETPYHLSRLFHLAWDRVVYGVAHRWAYILIGAPQQQGEGDFLDNLRDFLPGWYPEVVRAPGSPP